MPMSTRPHQRAQTVVGRIEATRAALQQLGFEVSLEHALLIECLRGVVHAVLDTVGSVAHGLIDGPGPVVDADEMRRTPTDAVA